LDGLQSLIESSATWDAEDRKAYSEFLLSLYAPEERDYGHEDSSDEDFDYLVEAQNETEDEEEYRNDPTARIPGKELVDLVSGKTSYSFRSKKPLHPRNATPKKKPRVEVKKMDEQSAACGSTERLSLEWKRAKPIMPANAKFHASQCTSSKLYFRQESLEQLALQVRRHIQLLIQSCLLVAQERLRDDSVLNLSKTLLSEWRRALDICASFRKFFTNTVSELEPDTSSNGYSVSFFETPTLSIIPELFSLIEKRDCLTSCDVQTLLERFFPFLEIDLLPKLPKYSFYDYSKYSILDAQYIDIEKLKSTSMSSPEKWSSAEDELIATLIRQYGSDWLENYERLLPSKRYEEVWRRYRYLSGRHAPENPVKHLVIERQKPLSSEEWRILEYGVYLYGDNAWKKIEINLLPHRDQIILQRMWKQRQKRRRQKIRENERHKQEARKLARQLRQQELEKGQTSSQPETTCLQQVDDKEEEGMDEETDSTQAQLENCSNWLIVSGDRKVHFSHEDDKKLLSQVKAFGATEDTFVQLAKTLGDGKTPQVMRKRYSQLLRWVQQSSKSVHRYHKCET